MWGVIIAGLGLPAPAMAAAEDAPALQVTGAMRIRHEWLAGQYRPGQPADERQLSLRTSLRADWRRDQWRITGEITDSRAWRDTTTPTTADINVFEPTQLFVARDVPVPFDAARPATVQAGRFALNVGSRRLISTGDVSNASTRYTGLRLASALPADAQVTLFAVMPQQRRPDDGSGLRAQHFALDSEGTDLLLWGIHYSSPALLPDGASGEISYIGLGEHGTARPSRARQLHNFGLRTLREPAAGHWDYEFEGIYQTGSIRTGTALAAPRTAVRAFFVHAAIGMRFVHRLGPRISLEYDHASGDGPGARHRRFDTLYGTRHPDLAPSGLYGLLSRTNLRSLGLRAELAPDPRLEVLATGRAAWADRATDGFSATGIRDTGGASGRRAGLQVEARVRYWVLPQRLRAEVNAAWFGHGRMLREAPNANRFGDTVYLAAALQHTF